MDLPTASLQRAAGTDTARSRFDSVRHYAGALWRANAGFIAIDRQRSGATTESAAHGGNTGRRTSSG